MQFKIDENLPIEISEVLINAGYNAKTVNEQQLQDVKDPLLINVCKSESRILVTLDTDFSDISQKASRTCVFGCFLTAIKSSENLSRLFSKESHEFLAGICIAILPDFLITTRFLLFFTIKLAKDLLKKGFYLWYSFFDCFPDHGDINTKIIVYENVSHT